MYTNRLFLYTESIGCIHFDVETYTTSSVNKKGVSANEIHLVLYLNDVKLFGLSIY